MSREPSLHRQKSLYHLYVTNESNRENRDWILIGHGNKRATASGDWKRVKQKVNELLASGGLAFAVFHWEPTRAGAWYINDIRINRGVDLDGRTVSASTRKK